MKSHTDGVQFAKFLLELSPVKSLNDWVQLIRWWFSHGCYGINGRVIQYGKGSSVFCKAGCRLYGCAVCMCSWLCVVYIHIYTYICTGILYMCVCMCSISHLNVDLCGMPMRRAAIRFFYPPSLRRAFLVCFFTSLLSSSLSVGFLTFWWLNFVRLLQYLCKL